jgi:cytochrome c556
MSQLMVDVIFPTSNAIFYVRDGPTNTKEWMELEFNAFVLGETANLLMAPERARDQGQWMKDAQLLLEVGTAAYRAAKRRDVAAIQALNDALYEACQSCHVSYRPGYRRRP